MQFQCGSRAFNEVTHVARKQSPQGLLFGGGPQASKFPLHVAAVAEAHAISFGDRVHLFARESALQTFRSISGVILHERFREVRCNRDVFKNAADDVEYFVGFQLTPNNVELPEQRADDQALSRVVCDEIDEDHRVVFLAEAVNATHALFESGGIPRDVVVHHQPAELQVDSFARDLERHLHGAGRSLRIPCGGRTRSRCRPAHAH